MALATSHDKNAFEMVDAIPGKTRGPRHLLLQTTIILLPFSYVPHELGVQKVSLTTFLVVLVILAGTHYGVLWRRAGAADTAALILALMFAINIAILGPLQGIRVNISDLLSSVGAVVAGVVLFRIARKPETHSSVKNALSVSLVILLAMTAYQLIAGLSRLQSLGYTDGFYYYTFEGGFRPFGPFLSPTVFGAYLAMVGLAVVFMHRGLAALGWFIAVAVGLIATDTRTAWIASLIAVVIVFAHRSDPQSRLRAAIWAVPVVLVGALLALLNWSEITTLGDRLAGIFDTGGTSTSARLALWDGVLKAITEAPLTGFGQRPFAEVVSPFAGEAANYGHAHENYLQILYFYGLPGLSVFIVLLLLAYLGVRRTVRSDSLNSYGFASLAALSVFAVDSFAETTWTSLSVVSTLFLLIGVGYSTSAEVRQLERRSK